jgi:hypothetical protein
MKAPFCDVVNSDEKHFVLYTKATACQFGDMETSWLWMTPSTLMVRPDHALNANIATNKGFNAFCYEGFNCKRACSLALQCVFLW